MFYVCSRRQNGKYGVLDTDTGVISDYTRTELLEKSNENISGVLTNEICVIPFRIYKTDCGICFEYRNKKYNFEFRTTSMGYGVYLDDLFLFEFGIIDYDIKYSLVPSDNPKESYKFNIEFKTFEYEVSPKFEIFILNNRKEGMTGVYLDLQLSNEYATNTNGIDKNYWKVNDYYYLRRKKE